MTYLTPRVRIWMTVVSYVAWVASVRCRRHAPAFFGTVGFAVGIAGAIYALALIISARATP